MNNQRRKNRAKQNFLIFLLLNLSTQKPINKHDIHLALTSTACPVSRCKAAGGRRFSDNRRSKPWRRESRGTYHLVVCRGVRLIIHLCTPSRYLFFKELKNVSVELYNNPKTLNLNRFMQRLMKGFLKEYVSLYIYYKLTEHSFF